MRGPVPIPSAVRELQGNPSRRPLNDAEPVTPEISVNPPAWMEDDEIASEFWHSIGNTIRAMKVGMESDRIALEMLAMCLAEVRRAYEKLDDEGRTVYTNQGGEQPSPHFKIMSKMISQAMSIMKEFGMTPAARTRVKSIAEGGGKSKLSKFLGGSHDK